MNGGSSVVGLVVELLTLSRQSKLMGTDMRRQLIFALLWRFARCQLVDSIRWWAWPLQLVLSYLWPGVFLGQQDPKPAQPYVAPKALAPQLPQHQGKLTVVLDLDETLIHSDLYVEGLQMFSATSQIMQLPFLSLGYPEVQAEGADPAVAPVRQFTSCPVVVHFRPGVRDFLLKASLIGELVLFTAGMPEYAKPIIEQLDPDGSLFGERRLFRQNVGVRRDAQFNRVYIKDLDVLGRDLRKVVLVDNCAKGMVEQPHNGFPCKAFFGELDDQHLATEVLPLLSALAMMDDVRPALGARFGVEGWLQRQGVYPQKAPSPVVPQVEVPTASSSSKGEAAPGHSSNRGGLAPNISYRTALSRGMASSPSKMFRSQTVMQDLHSMG